MESNLNWQKELSEYCFGWHTWNNDSILSYIVPNDGRGLRLCIKDYKNAAFMENVLIGDENESVIPKAHAYDDSYTHVTVEWKDNHFDVITATEDGELYILVRCEDNRIKPSTLIIQGLSLYNLGAVVKKSKSSEGKEFLILEGVSGKTNVYSRGVETQELYVPLSTPYISVTLEGEIAICTGSESNLDKIHMVIDKNRNKYLKDTEKYGENKECYKAMQICQAWDTIYDQTMKTPITTVSRIWNRNWGGYVLFCWDTYFGALMQSLDNKVLAYSNIFAITNAITDRGFVPNYSCQNGFKSFDRSQPPVGSSVCLEVYERYGEKWFLEEVFDKLLLWNRWFYENRRTDNGLLTWGSNPYEPFYGHSLEYDGINDWQGASYESGLDNSPMYENIPFNKEKHIFEMDDVGLTGLYIQDCRALNKIAEELGRISEASELITRLDEMEDKLEQLWDEDTGLYLNRRTDTGAFEYHLSPFHFHALFSSNVSKERKKRMINEHLLNPNEFWTNYPLPSISKSDSSYVKQTYWQGRVWAPMNYLVYRALKYAGELDICEMLAHKSSELILKEWKECGHVHENYDPETGEGCNNNRSDKFYHWGGLLAYMNLS